MILIVRRPITAFHYTDKAITQHTIEVGDHVLGDRVVHPNGNVSYEVDGLPLVAASRWGSLNLGKAVDGSTLVYRFVRPIRTMQVQALTVNTPIEAFHATSPFLTKVMVTAGIHQVGNVVIHPWGQVSCEIDGAPLVAGTRLGPSALGEALIAVEADPSCFTLVPVYSSP